jgi:hypothetical protein
VSLTKCQTTIIILNSSSELPLVSTDFISSSQWVQISKSWPLKNIKSKHFGRARGKTSTFIDLATNKVPKHQISLFRTQPTCEPWECNILAVIHHLLLSWCKGLIHLAWAIHQAPSHLNSYVIQNWLANWFLSALLQRINWLARLQEMRCVN